jgi:hypothetical protein
MWLSRTILEEGTNRSRLEASQKVYRHRNLGGRQINRINVLISE